MSLLAQQMELARAKQIAAAAASQRNLFFLT